MQSSQHEVQSLIESHSNLAVNCREHGELICDVGRASVKSGSSLGQSLDEFQIKGTRMEEQRLA